MKRTLAILAVLLTPILGFARGASSSGGDPVVGLAFFAVIIFFGVISAALRSASKPSTTVRTSRKPKSVRAQGRVPQPKKVSVTVPEGETELITAPEAIAELISTYLTEEPTALLAENSRVLIDFAVARYSVTPEREHCLLQVWSEERNLVSSVVSAKRIRNWLRLGFEPTTSSATGVQRFGQAKPSRMELCPATWRMAFVNKPPTLTISVSAPQAGGTDKDS